MSSEARRLLVRMRVPARLAACLWAGVIALSAGGCLGTSVAPAPEVPRSATPTAPAIDPNALVWVLPARPSGLDPARMEDDAAAAQIAAQIYDRLVQFRPGTTDLAPGIAENWTSDPDGRSFTFTLREGLRFHDGTPLDASAVVWNVERWMNPKHAAHKGEFRAWRDYFGGFVGETDQQGRTINLVSRVEALDQRTVRVVLHAPFAPFLQHLAMMPFGFASPTAVLTQGEAYGMDGAHLPVGSGPFRAIGWTDDGTVALTANADHWSGAPSIPALWFVTLTDPASRLSAVANGTAHGAELSPTDVPSGTLVSGATLVPRPPRSTVWLMLNQSREPLGDARVRKAISMAIDRERLVREHFGWTGMASGQLLPPGFLGYEPSVAPTAYDPDGARSLLAEAGVDSLKLNIWVANTARGYLPDPIGTAEAIARMLGQVGIAASVKSENMRQFLMDRDRGKFTAWITGWESQSGDPDSTWFWHFGAGRTAAEGQYVKPELAAALLRAQRTVNSQQRDAIYRAAAQTVAADEARAFLAHTRPLVAVSERVDGYLPSPMGFDSFRDVVLAPRPDVPPGATLVLPVPIVAATATATGTVTATAEVTATGTATVTGTVTSMSVGAGAGALTRTASSRSGIRAAP